MQNAITNEIILNVAKVRGIIIFVYGYQTQKLINILSYPLHTTQGVTLD